VRVVVSFSILEDIVREVGGGDVVVTSLIGRDANEHVF
jgi:ABC-type Zn uptake system ZnuABC Zn-binding protein ZnuA